MLRPIRKLKPSPIATAASATQAMKLRVRVCAMVSAAAAATLFLRAGAMMSSAIDGSRRLGHAFADTGGFGEAQDALLLHQHAEIDGYVGEAVAQGSEIATAGGVDRALDRGEAAGGQRMGGFERCDQVLARPG